MQTYRQYQISDLSLFENRPVYSKRYGRPGVGVAEFLLISPGRDHLGFWLQMMTAEQA